MVSRKNYRKRIIRVELNDTLLQYHDIADPYPDPDSPGSSLKSVVPDIGEVEFHLEESAVSGYGTGFPEGEISFNFPAEDAPRVAAWFSNDYRNVTLPASETLLKNMGNAVRKFLKEYDAAVESQGKFGSPFMLEYRLWMVDGSVYRPEEPRLMVPVATGPDLIITGYKVEPKSLLTRVMVSAKASELRITHPEQLPSGVKGLDVRIGIPAALRAVDSAVSGVRSVRYDNDVVPSWHYVRYTATEVEDKARSATEFKTIYTYGETGLTGNGETGENGSEPPLYRPYIDAETAALDLGSPESYKRVVEVYLRGIFPRSGIELEVMVSEHREGWRRIGRSRGPFVVGLRGERARWWKVRIRGTMRPGDRMEGLTFVCI